MSPRRWVSIAVGVLAAGVAVWLVVRDQSARMAIENVAVGTLAVVLLLQVVNVVADSVRYRMALPARYRARLGRSQWHRIFAVGRLLNSVIPQGGMAYRALHLRLAMGIPVSAFFGSVAMISWLGNGLVLTLVGVLVVVGDKALAGAIVIGIGLSVLLLIALVPALAQRGGPVRRRLPDRLDSIIDSFSESFVELFGSGGLLRPVLAVTLLTQLTGAAAFVVICAALGIDNALAIGSVLYAATTVMTFVSLTPAGLGITELAVGLAGGLMEIGSATGILVALIVRITGLASVGILAAAAGLTEGPASPEATE